MQLQDYKKLAGVVHWPQFAGMLHDAYVKEFEETSKHKYGEYREMRRFLREAIKRFPQEEAGTSDANGERAAMVEAHPIDDKQAEDDYSDEDDDDEFAAEASGSAARVQHVALVDESPISFIRKQLEAQPQQATSAVPLSQLAGPKQQPQQDEERPPSPEESTSPPSVSMEHSGYEMTQEKVFQPSTEENYNVDDLSSNDGTDDDEHPRKTIPAWAQSGNVAVTERVLTSVVTQDQRRRHFGKMVPPTLEALFKETQKKHRRGMLRSPDHSDESMEWESSPKK